jgi:hypothetical protein
MNYGQGSCRPDLWLETFFDLGGDTSPALLSKRVRETIAEAHSVVKALEAAMKTDSRIETAYVLVAQSAANVLKAAQRSASETLLAPDSHPTGAIRSSACSRATRFLAQRRYGLTPSGLGHSLAPKATPHCSPALP